MKIYNLVTGGACAGICSIVSYLVIAFIDLPVPLTFLLAMMFPILGIAFIYSAKEFIEGMAPSFVNKLAFVYGTIAFSITAIFLSAQLAVQAGIDTTGSATLKEIKSSIRLVDMGMDVAWDLFIGSFMILFMFSVQKIKSLKWWGIVMGVLGIALIILNVITFPDPPADKGLFDIGPFIGVYILILAIKMLVTGLRMKKETMAV
jgi:peptidoglycan/LPS O-acetylase OafA/YrhL